MQTWVLILAIIALGIDHVDLDFTNGKTLRLMPIFRLIVLIICCIWG